MTGGFGDVVAAELVKLRTLPGVVATVGGTAGTAVAVVATTVATAQSTGEGGPADVDAVALICRAVPILQAGPIIIGVLGGAAEYAGGLLRTALVACPDRRAVLAGRAAAHLFVAALTATAVLGAGLTTGWIAGAGRPVGWAAVQTSVGAAGYLVLVGLLGHAVAVALRGVLPGLAVTLGLVFVVCPVLAGFTGVAGVLPERAGRLLAGVSDAAAVAVPELVTGLIVLLGWIEVVGTVAATVSLRRDV
ncbi:hypothetical protein ACFHWS_26200 [Micromonospora sp. LOL_013]|uniref:hypothetical protein n=1 Tax=Micromonospora sp. LOL_013 TaxID=3345414 RepID=UPI003A84BD9D